MSTEDCVITCQDVQKASKDTATMKWQRRWDHSTTGRHMYTFQPAVSVIQPKTKFPFSHSYQQTVQLRTGYAKLKSYLYKIGHSDSAICNCGLAEETVSHYLLDCPDHEDPRERLAHKVHTLTGETLSTELLLSEGKLDPYKGARTLIVHELGAFVDDTNRLRTTATPSAMFPLRT